MSQTTITALFAREEDLLAATRAARDKGYEILDAHTPYAVHGIEEAMGLRPSRLTWVCFLAGAVGLLLAFLFQFWTSATDWPMNVGGKPFQSWPAFLPVAFEVTILFAGLGVVIAMLLRCGLLPGRAPALPMEGITDDHFALLVRGSARAPAAEIEALFAAHHALRTERGSS